MGVLALIESLLFLEPILHAYDFPFPEVGEGQVACSSLLCDLIAVQSASADASPLEKTLPVCIQLLKGDLGFLIYWGLTCRCVASR